MKDNLGYLVDVLEKFLSFISLTAVMAALCLAMGGCGKAGEEEAEPHSASGEERTAFSGKEEAADSRYEEHMEISVAYVSV